MFEYLTAHGKTVFMNADDPIQLQKLGQYIHKVGFSVQNPQYYQIKFLGARPFVQLEVEGIDDPNPTDGPLQLQQLLCRNIDGKIFRDTPAGHQKGIGTL